MPVSDDRYDPSRRPIFVVMNAGSGDKDAERREAVIREVLSQAGRPHQVSLVRDKGKLPAVAREVVELARQQDGIVVAAGGDGTINSVAQVVAPSGCRFGVLPQGTFNYFSRTHGIPLDTAEATKLLLNGVVRPVQVGLVNDRLFVVNASVGLYPKLLEKREVHKEKFGRTRLVAMFSALLTLLTPPRQLVLTLEEGGEKEVIYIATLLVENNYLQLKEVGLPEAKAVQEGQLAAIVVKAKGILQMLAVVVSAALGRLQQAESVSTFPFRSLSINPLGLKRIKVATDGEVTWLAPPLVFKVSPHPLRLIVAAEPATGDAP